MDLHRQRLRDVGGARVYHAFDQYAARTPVALDGAYMRHLGETQKNVLAALATHGGWPGGWYWGTYSGTVRICNSLVKRGLAQVKKTKSYDQFFSITPEGLKLLEKTSYGYRFKETP